MSFDGVFTRTMVKELSDCLVSGRISKIHQPYENEIILIIRAQKKNHKLLLSAHPSYARIQLTNIAYANPQSPSNFVMMLRKFLDGAILSSIQQIQNDRIIHFTFTRRNELGDLQNILLIVELMGRHSTIALVNKQTNKILDVIKHVGSSQNSYRSLLPGSTYINPPEQAKNNPFTVKKEKVFELLSTTETLTAQYMQQHFQGLGRDTAEELCFRLNKQPNKKMIVWDTFFSLSKTNYAITPTFNTNKKKDFFTPFPYESISGEKQSFDSLSTLLDYFYEGKAEKDRTKQQGSELIHKVATEKKKNNSKLIKLKKTLKETADAEKYRINGELLTTFLSQVPKGSHSVELANYYENNALLTIALNPALSHSQNAQKYFQKYQKLKNAVKIVTQQIIQTENEIAYLDSVISQLELARPMDIEIIKEELIQEGYIKKRSHKKRATETKSLPEKFYSQDGTLILVGKNNLQNDQLTLKIAKKTDIWLHAKDIPGSHVIIKDNQPTQETLMDAAVLAAYYSKYRLSSQVPVDYVAVKHVYKPNGSKPGYVTYEKQKTLFVTPEKQKIEQLSIMPQSKITHS